MLQNTPRTPRRNWAGNYQYSSNKELLPRSVEEAQGLVARSSKIKAQGTCHSFNSIADCSRDIISLRNLNRIISVDPASMTATVEGCINYAELSLHLQKSGFALQNLASLPHISVVGSCSTATHGSGVKNKNLSSAVSAMEFISADGSLHILTRKSSGEAFNGAVVGLGGIGIVTRLSLDIVPTFEVTQSVYENLPFQELSNNLYSVLSTAYSVSLFTEWKNDFINQVWVKHRTTDNKPLDISLLGATQARKNMHPISELSAENCTEQLNKAGPWHERLPHFKINLTPSSGNELQSEYFVPMGRAVEALQAVHKIKNLISPLLLISEIRSVAADNLWMSPCYKQDFLAIHFTWKSDWPGVRSVLPVLENTLKPFNARPHWAKLFTMDPARLKSLYPRLQDFQRMLAIYDPLGKFRNEFLGKYVFG